MALTTRALVLQRLGMTDDAASAGGLTIAVDSTAGSAVWAKSGSTVTITRTTGGATNFDISTASYDTISELAAGIAALSGVAASAVDATVGALASSLLSDTGQTIGPVVSEPVVGVIPYANTAAGYTASLIDNLITYVDSAIGRFCNRVSSTGSQTFESGSLDEKYDGDGEPVLNLRNWPITAVSSITILDSGGTVVSTLATTDYIRDDRTARLYWNGSNVDAWSPAGTDGPVYGYIRSGWPRGFQNVRVQYTGGWATVPPDLVDVATRCVCDLFLNRRRNDALASQSANGIVAQYLSPEEAVAKYANLLGPFRSYAV